MPEGAFHALFWLVGVCPCVPEFSPADTVRGVLESPVVSTGPAQEKAAGKTCGRRESSALCVLSSWTHTSFGRVWGLKEDVIIIKQ